MTISRYMCVILLNLKKLGDVGTANGKAELISQRAHLCYMRKLVSRVCAVLKKKYFSLSCHLLAESGLENLQSDS